MHDEMPTTIAWNGAFPLAEQGCAFWQIGPFQLWASRLPSEIRLAYARTDDPLESTLVVEVPSNRPDAPTGTKVHRFGFRRPPDSLNLVPALADRPVVVSPEDALVLPPQEEITLFISTPLWLQVVAGEAVLLDQPTHRPTDTWFGVSTMQGELCYATRTKARMTLDSLPVRPHRVISLVHVANGAKTDLSIERLRLPAMQMSVHVTREGHFWTESVTLERQGDGDSAEVRLGQGPPPECPEASLAAGPRTPAPRGLLTRAFAGLLRLG